MKPDLPDDCPVLKDEDCPIEEHIERRAALRREVDKEKSSFPWPPFLALGAICTSVVGFIATGYIRGYETFRDESRKVYQDLHDTDQHFKAQLDEDNKRLMVIERQIQASQEVDLKMLDSMEKNRILLEKLANKR